MNAIVEIRGRQALTTSEAVAEGCGIQHKNMLALIRKYGEEFATLGEVAFETRKGQPLPQGGFEGLDESTLSNDEAELLEAIRDRNRAFLLTGLDYADRKARLFEFATRYRTRLLSYHQEQEAA